MKLIKTMMIAAGYGVGCLGPDRSDRRDGVRPGPCRPGRRHWQC